MHHSLAFVLLLSAICILYVGSAPGKQRRQELRSLFKPGYCPDVVLQPVNAPGPKVRCGRFCKFDRDCYGDKRCCATGCGVDCRNPVYY